MRVVTILCIVFVLCIPNTVFNQCLDPDEQVPYVLAGAASSITTPCGEVFDLCMDFYNLGNNVGPDTFELNIFSNDSGAFDYCASDSIPGATTKHGKIIRLPNCKWGFVPGPTFTDQVVDSFDYGLVINDSCINEPDYCDSGNGKIWTINSRYEGNKTVANISVASRHGQSSYNVPVTAIYPLKTGEYFFANGKSLDKNSNWTFTFTYYDNTTEDVDVHTSCSAPIFGLTHPVDNNYNTIGNTMTPVSGCVTTPGTQSTCIGEPQHLNRGNVKTRVEVSTQFVDTSRVFIISNNTVLPIRLENFEVKSMKSSNKITWNVNSVSNEDKLSLQKSYNGSDFSEVVTFDEIYTGAYKYNDIDIKKAINYYRIAVTDFNGATQYSDILLNRRPGVSRSVSIFPQPSNDKTTIRVNGLERGIKISRVGIFDISGRMTMTVNHDNDGDMIINLADHSLNAGLYMIRVELSDGEILNRKLIKR